LTLQALALVGGTALLSYALRDWSGGHVNPLMTFAIGMAGRQHWRPAIAYSIGHIAGAIIGLTLIIAFAPDSPVFPVTDARVIAEFIAAAAVIATAVALRNEAAIDAALGTGAVLAVIYWVSGGQTLANPAITLAQGVFGYGLSLSHAGPIVAAQFLGALSGYNAAKLLWP
jgi:glycerol uptake facilitator-like aquaporin